MDRIDTKYWVVDNDVEEDNPTIVDIAKRFKSGQVIAFPTETVYGLGANALDGNAIKRIFEAKGRPSDNPLIIHIASENQLVSLVEEVNDKSKMLIQYFWPGPLTIIFKRKQGISDLVTAGLDTVAVRMPSHPVALALIKAAGLPIAAPSANRSGKPSPTKAEHVKHDLDGRIDGIVDGGATGVGVESTVIDVSGEKPIVLRPGGITIEALESVVGEVELDPALMEQTEKPRSPGMKYTHYAPSGEMWIVQGEPTKVVKKINNMSAEMVAKAKRVGILTTNEHKDLFPYANLVLAFGTRDNLYPIAEHLYEALRQFDLEVIDYIIAEGFSEQGIGLAIMNRLRKASSGNMINL